MAADDDMLCDSIDSISDLWLLAKIKIALDETHKAMADTDSGDDDSGDASRPVAPSR